MGDSPHGPRAPVEASLSAQVRALETARPIAAVTVRPGPESGCSSITGDGAGIGREGGYLPPSSSSAASRLHRPAAGYSAHNSPALRGLVSEHRPQSPHPSASRPARRPAYSCA
jgi:hypothetical protein